MLISVPFPSLVQRVAKLRTILASENPLARVRAPLSEPAVLSSDSPKALIDSIIVVARKAASERIENAKSPQTDIVSRMELLFDALAYASVAAEFDETASIAMEQPIAILRSIGKEICDYFRYELEVISSLDKEAKREPAEKQIALLQKLQCLFPTDPWFMFYMAGMNMEIALAEEAASANPSSIFATVKKQLDSSEKSLFRADSSYWCIRFERISAAALLKLINALNQKLLWHLAPYVRPQETQQALPQNPISVQQSS